MNKDLERLAWRLIDGDISPGDRNHLEKLQAEDPDVRAEIERLRGLSGILALGREMAPPPELRPRIDRAVASSSPAWRRSASVVNLWRPRFAYLAAGLLVGAVVARLLLPVSDRQIDVERVTGAMRAAPSQSVGDAAVELEGYWGTLSQWRDGDLLINALDLTTDQPVELILETEGGTMDLVNALHSGGSTSEVQVGGNRLAVHAAGAGRHVLVLAPTRDATMVSALVVSDGEVLASQRVLLGDIGKNP